MRYKSRVVAEKAQRHSLAERGIELRIYGCPRCHGFHLTSQPNTWVPPRERE